ncbi:MAG: LCP family protein [Dethiobacter sp.]|nr:LCP family protein [Dethiobacter sp.]MBS3899574.1 LCP family protein [Dethiobacter sp.]
MAKARYYTVRTKRHRLRTGRLLFLLALCALLLSILLSVRLLSSLNAIQDRSAWIEALPAPTAAGPEHLLLYSVSDSNNRGAVTALVLLAYHPAEERFRAIAVPPDTLLGVQEHGFMRVAEIFGTGGRELLISAVSEFFALPIHTYLEVDETFLPTALDLLQADSVWEKLQITTGGDILAVIHAEGLTVAEQLERRQNVLAAISAEVLNAGTLGRVRNLLEVSPLIRTNMSWRELLTAMGKYKDTSFAEAVSMTELPGEEQVQADGSFWLVDTEAIPDLANWLTDQQATIPRRQITVEILNGSGLPGVATAVAGKLKAEGFNVLRVGNADSSDFEASKVISRIENMDAAKAVAIMLPGAQLLKEENPEKGVHVTVIVGKNYLAE